MTKENIFDVLEICFQNLEKGMDVESCLARYPELADDLRPALMASVQLSSLPDVKVSDNAARRGKARFLQAAAEMREQDRPVSALPFWRKNGFFGARFFRMAITTATMVAFLLTGGTGLVSASSSALPGDQLYTVKRSWEDVQLFFVFDSHAKIELANEFDHQRVQEIEELYSEKRIAAVNFQGVVQTQQKGAWMIDGLTVVVNHETILKGEILSGSIVKVIGETDDGIVKAHQIIFVATIDVTSVANSATPTLIPENTASNTEQPENTNIPGSVDENNAGSHQNHDDDNPTAQITPTPRGTENGSSEHHSTQTPTPHDSHSRHGDNGDWRNGESSHHSTATPIPDHEQHH